ncbi:L-2-amino-thiazoline-4-carboxylic acid hydrolase [Acidobacteriota bacterium]
MNVKRLNILPTRREFLKNALPAGSLLCVGCSNLFAASSTDDTQQADTEKHPFKRDSGMTVEEAYQFSYQHGHIGLLKNLAKEIGRDKFVAMIKKIEKEEAVRLMKSVVQNMRKRDFFMFKTMWKSQRPPYNLAKVYEITEETDTVFEIKYSECLYARMFLEEDAADIGYATQCYSSDVFFETFNSKLKYSNPKNFMREDDICIERFDWET